MVRKRILIVLAFFPFLKAFLVAQPVSGGGPLADCRQVVLVVSPDDTGIRARLACYSRKAGGNWTEAGIRTPVVLGRTGLAWGVGMHPAEAGTRKAEGDGKSPAGVYLLGPVFGRAADGQLRFRMPYQVVTEDLECVDDPASGLYNRLVERGSGPADWASSERMAEVGPQYAWGLFVQHNLPPKPSGGSCIFLHIWGGADEATAGCTAMPEPVLLDLLEWLDPDLSPRLVQLTEPAYRLYREEWGLPALP